VPATAILKNAKLNKLNDKVSLLIPGARRRTLTFSSDGDTANHVIVADETNDNWRNKVPIITIDALFIKAKPALIKLILRVTKPQGIKWRGRSFD